MKKRSKRYRAWDETVSSDKQYPLTEAVKLLKQFQNRKFNESLEIHFQLGIRPGQSDEMVRGTVGLPNGTGKTVRVLCFCKGEGVKEAENAGADYVGADELIAKALGGWMDFDAVVAHPDMMREVSKLGRILGPKGLMPTPKTGTVTPNVAKAVKEIKAGKVNYKSDKTGGLHVACGKMSFSEQALVDNAKTVIHAVVKSKPSSVKSGSGYVRKLSMSSTQSPGLRIELSSLIKQEVEA